MLKKQDAPGVSRWWRRLLAAIVVCSVGAGIALVTASPAAAATIGPGYSYGGNPNSHVGAYMADGRYTYCLEPGKPAPLGTSTSLGNLDYFVSTGPAAGANPSYLGDVLLRKLNYLIFTYGSTSDNNQAAAVAIVVGSTANPAAYAAHTAPYGDAYYSTYMSAANWNVVKALVAQFRAEVAAYTEPATPTASIAFQVDHANNYAGTLTITALSAPASSVLINLTNGVFTSTGTSSYSGPASLGMALGVRGTPPLDGSPYKIRATAHFFGTVYTVDPKLRVYSAGPGQQHTGGAATRTAQGWYAYADDPTLRESEYMPKATTQVSSVALAKGDKFRDVVTFGLAEDDNGVTNEWARSGANYHPITAQGTVYGPFLAPPTPSAAVPAGTPVAGTFSVTTGNLGPTIPYIVETDETMDEPGYYVAVITIDRALQRTTGPNVQAYIPEGYVFTDEFGQVAETSIVPFDLEITTHLDSNVAVIGEQIVDHASVSAKDDKWLLTNATTYAPVAAEVNWYWSETEPVRSSTVDPQAELFGTTIENIVGPDPSYTSAAIRAPWKAGWITAVWCWTPSVYVTGGCDDYGIPAETARLDAPTFVTEAVPVVAPTDSVHDAVTVTGAVPNEGGVDISFAGYLQPELAAAPVCDASTLVYESTAPLNVTTAGTYTSEDFEVLIGHVGTIYWVETVTATRNGVDALIHQGVCGVPEETTIVELPTVTSMAVMGGGLGGTIFDVATVTGTVPAKGLSVSFAAYLQPEDATLPVCDATTLVLESSIEHEALFAGDVQSEDFVVDKTAIGTLFWVETAQLYDIRDDLIWEHVGECGLANETTRTVDVYTTAVSSVVTGESAHDTAFIRGAIPTETEHGIRAELTFEAFHQAGEAGCVPENRVFSTEDNPIVVTEVGTYESAATKLSSVGSYFWVETLTFVDVATEKTVIAHKGECGAPGETTTVLLPPTGFNGAWLAWLAVALVVIGTGPIIIGLGVRRRSMAA